MRKIVSSVFRGLVITGLAGVVACSTARVSRQYVDSSTHHDSPPDWVVSTKLSWESDGKVIFKASHTIRGDERITGCFDLSQMDARESLISEISSDIRGSLDNAQQSLSENAELVLGKVRSSEFGGTITGLRFAEQYFERYRIGETERIDCHTLAEIRQSDYDRIKQAVLYKVVAVDPRLRDAIARKQVDFFKPQGAAQAVNSTLPAVASLPNTPKE